MKIFYENSDIISKDLLCLMEKGAKFAFSLHGLDDKRISLSISFVSSTEIRELNREYRSVDKVTDVLSFPQFSELSEIPPEGEILLGDVVICKDKAEEQAKEFGHSFEREIIYLFIHSILHLLGYDHMEEDEKREMRKREEEIMEYLKLPRE